jgi:hypothetical protein
MNNQVLNETAQLLRQDWDLKLPDTLSEEALLQLLADKIVKIIEQGPVTFFQLMYRLDISERKLLGVLADEHAPAKIARLIYDRQLQKIQSRRNNKAEKQDDDPELEW